MPLSDVLKYVSRDMPEGRVKSTVETVAGRVESRTQELQSRSVPSIQQPSQTVSYETLKSGGVFTGPGKISQIIDYVTQDMSEGRVKETVGVVAGRVYGRLGPPESFKQTVDVPHEIYSSGQLQAVPLYYRMDYEQSQGLDTSRTHQRLVGELSKSRYWWETYARFEGGKRWSDIEREEPAVYFKRDPVSGVFYPEYDFTRWYYEKYRPQKEKRVGSLGSVAGDISYSFLNIFDPGTWTSAISGNLPEYHARKEYENIRDIQKGKGWEVWTRIQAPAYQNIILPFAAGAGIGKGLQLIGAAGHAATGATIGKILTGYSRAVPWVMGGTISTMVGTDIGLTAARQQTGDWVKDWTSPEVLGKTIGLGMQFTSAYAGYRWATSFKPTVGYSVDKYGNLVIRKHLTSVFDRPVLGYGKPVVLGATKGLSVARVVSPDAGRGVSGFKSARSFLKSFPMQDFSGAIRGDMVSPFHPPGLAGYQKLQYGYTSPVGKPVVYGSKWRDKLFVETGLDWQPKPKWGKLSTMAYPKPIPYRAYETYYRFMVYTKPVSTLFYIRTKPVFLKPSKQFTVKDVVPSDKSIKFDKGDIGSILDQGTITIQETKVDVISKTKTEQITSPLSKDIVVPQSLLKPVYSRIQMFKPKLEQRFQGLRSVYKTEQMQKQGYISLLQPLSVQMTKQAFVFVQALDFEKAYKQDQMYATVPISGIAEDVAFDKVFRYDTLYKGVSVFEQPVPPKSFDYQTYLPKSPPPPPPVLFDIDSGKRRKEKKYKFPWMVGYRIRRWKVPRLKDFIGGS